MGERAGRRYLDATQNNAGSSCYPRPAYRKRAPASQPALIDLTGDSEVGEGEERTTTRGLAPPRVPVIKRGPENSTDTLETESPRILC